MIGQVARRRSLGSGMRIVPLTPGRSASRGLGAKSPYLMSGGRNAVQYTQHELAEMYSKIIGMSASGKISAKNAWDLNLVDNMDKILQLDEQNKRTHFQKASHTIQAASQIYGYRVDSVHQHTYKVLTNFNSAPVPGEEDAGAGAAAGAKRRRPGKTTIASELFCNVDMAKLTSEVDPMFHKTATAFDEGGSRGLLLNNLTVHNGCNLVFDSTVNVNEVAGEEEPETQKLDWITGETAYVQKKSQNFRSCVCPALKSIHDALAKVKASMPTEPPPEEAPAQPAPQPGAPNRLNFDESAASQPGAPWQNVGNADAFFGVDDNEEMFNAERMEQELQEAIHKDNLALPQDDMSAISVGGADPWNDQNFAEVRMGDFELFQAGDKPVTDHRAALGVAAAVPGQPLNEDEATTLVNPALLKNWAGPDMWLYRRMAAKRRLLLKKLAQDGEKKEKKKADPHMLDFNRVLRGELVDEASLAPPAKADSTVLSDRSLNTRGDKSTILPQDLKWQNKWFARLFTKPDFYCGFNRNEFRKRPNPSNGEEVGEEEDLQKGWYDYDNPNDNDFVAYDDVYPQDQTADDANEKLELIKAPDKLRKVDVEYASVMKVINVKALKHHIFKHIESTCMRDMDADNDDGTAAQAAAKSSVEEEPAPSANPTSEPNGGAGQPDRPWSSMMNKVHGGDTSFAKTVLSLKGMEPRQLSQISIPFCFMCTLHLANEKNLRFVGIDVSEGQALTDFAITVDKDT